MSNLSFSIEESKYIFTDLFNPRKAIYMEKYDSSLDIDDAMANVDQSVPILFYVTAHNLPVGKYIIHIEDFQYAFKNSMQLKSQGILCFLKNAELTFSINDNTSINLLFTTHNMAAKAVYELRLQNLEKLKAHNPSLISKAIAQHTNLGESYNQASFLDTIDECLEYDIPLNVDKSKPLTDFYVKYLRNMKLMQEKKHLARKKLDLELEERKLQQEENLLLNS